MTIRLIELPTDLIPLGEMVTECFQYPENESWSIQTEERDQIVDMMKNLRRLWPLVRVIQTLSPPLRDLLRGCVWEEDDQIAGATIVQRRGSTSTWVIGTVGVLPAYRRRGIARKLVEASLELIRERGGDKVMLEVIDGNLPAYTLYEKLGFEHYSGTVVFHVTPEQTIPEPTLPLGYTQSPLGFFDWEPRYELEKRIAPESVCRYEPVEVGRFRRPALMRLLWPLVTFAQGTREEGIVIRAVGEGIVVAQGRCSMGKSQGTPLLAAGGNGRASAARGVSWYRLFPWNLPWVATRPLSLSNKVCLSEAPGLAPGRFTLTPPRARDRPAAPAVPPPASGRSSTAGPG